MLTDEQITKFQNIYKKNFGKEISREVAYDMGAKLVELFKLVYKPMTETEFREVWERMKQN